MEAASPADTADAAVNALRDATRFLRAELRPFPGRANTTLRCVVTSAIVIVTSMTLQVPFLALSLICVFYVIQSNVVITRLAGMLFLLGAFLAIGLSLLIIKYTFDYPLLRVATASLVLFFSLWAMRVLKVGVMFFIVSIVVIYVQSFVDLTDASEIMVRLILWCEVAVSYAIATTLVVNTLLLPAEPVEQLKAEIHRQLTAVDAQLVATLGQNAPARAISLAQIQAGATALQKLLRFSTMRDARYRAQAHRQLALVATVSHLYRAASEIPERVPALDDAQRNAIAQLRADCAAFDAAVQHDTPFRLEHRAGASGLPRLDQMRRALEALAAYDADHKGASSKEGAAEAPMLAPDAFTNPVYVRFALKTLLAVLIGYTFYNTVHWQGIHTIMLTCLIVAQPGLGASAQKALLRVGGAIVGSLLALFMVVFVIPHLDSVVGLLAMALPVIALGAWTTAGSERISYAGIQIMFTFSLALLESFGPSTNLTEIRDRMMGILLGVVLSIGIQTLIWPEGEADSLRHKLAALLRTIAGLLRADAAQGAGPDPLPRAQRHLLAWGSVGENEALLARVALEPDWHEGEHERTTLRGHTVLAQAREILLASEALHEAQTAAAGDLAALDAVQHAQRDAAATLDQYADALAASPPAARTPITPVMPALSVSGASALAASVTTAARDLAFQLSGLPDWRGTQAEERVPVDAQPEQT